MNISVHERVAFLASDCVVRKFRLKVGAFAAQADWNQKGIDSIESLV
jgi:hypothetical protein